MGGLVSLGAINMNPQLFQSCVFVGTPFKSAPIILWALNKGFPSFMNPKFFGAAEHMRYQSAFVFLPKEIQVSQSCRVDLWHPES